MTAMGRAGPCAAGFEQPLRAFGSRSVPRQEAVSAPGWAQRPAAVSPAPPAAAGWGIWSGWQAVPGRASASARDLVPWPDAWSGCPSFGLRLLESGGPSPPAAGRSTSGPPELAELARQPAPS